MQDTLKSNTIDHLFVIFYAIFIHYGSHFNDIFLSDIFQHIGSSSEVIASFQQTLWTVVPMSAGAIRVKSMGK